MNDQERYAHNIRNLPPHAFAVSPPGARGKLIMIAAGDTRYVVADSKIKEGETPAQAADRENQALRVTPPQREAMVHGSIFGFHTPAADPDSYDADGKDKEEIVANTDPASMRDLLHSKEGERKIIRAFFEHLMGSGHDLDYVEDVDLETCLDEFHGIDRERLTIEQGIVEAASR